jgi:rod shape-determining protein MreC
MGETIYMSRVKNFLINRKSKNWLKFLIGAVALLFLLWVLNIFVSPIKNIFYTLSSPIQKTFLSVGESSSYFFGSFLDAGSSVKENENLKIENQKLLFQVASLQSIEQGNQAQSDVSVACQNNGFKLVMAGVVGLDDNDILSINKGSADGISEGMPVINQQNVLFGKIFKVYKDFSEVILVSNKNSVVNVKIQQNDIMAPEIDGVVKGSGGLNAYLDLIPISSDINPQDVLVTSAIGKSFPKDLLVAKITQDQKNDQKPFQQAQISLFFDVKTADNLFVITNYKQTY